MVTKKMIFGTLLAMTGVYTAGAMDVSCASKLFIENKSGWALTIIYRTQQDVRMEVPMRQGEKLKELICVDQIRAIAFMRRGMVWGMGASEISLNDQLATIQKEIHNPSNKAKEPVIVIAATTLGWHITIGWQAGVLGSIVMPEEEYQSIDEQYKDVWRFVNVPDAYKQRVIDYAHRQQGNEEVSILKDAQSNAMNARMLVWSAVGDQYGLRLSKDPMSSGLWFWNAHENKPVFKGTRALNDQLASFTFKDFYRVAGSSSEKRIMQKLIDDYKIHYMPIGDLTPTLIKLFELIKNSPQLQQDIWSVKCNSRYDDEQLKRAGSGSPDARPKIVIYPSSSQQAANRVLDILFTHFKNDPGLGVAPRFNQRITDLIYVSQGNGDDKVGNNLEYFQAPDYVYFNAKKVAEILEVDPSTLKFKLTVSGM
jgi:hypothetical protein